VQKNKRNEMKVHWFKVRSK